jgi:hypothetical protein
MHAPRVEYYYSICLNHNLQFLPYSATSVNTNSLGIYNDYLKTFEKHAGNELIRFIKH